MMHTRRSLPAPLLPMRPQECMRTLHQRIQPARTAGLALLLLALAAVLFQSRFALGLNATTSLPHTLYLIHKGAPAARGHYVAFRWQGGGSYPAGLTFVKILAGMPGDTVSEIDREYFVNGAATGTAKRISNTGKPLAAGPTGDRKSTRLNSSHT